jgi:hypothetical protein
MVVGGEARFRGHASANFRSEVGSPNLCQECEHVPQLSFKSQAPKESKSSAKPLPKRCGPFGLLHCLLYIVFEERASSSLVIDRSFYLKASIMKALILTSKHARVLLNVSSAVLFVYYPM